MSYMSHRHTQYTAHSTHKNTRLLSFTIGIFNITDTLRSEVIVLVHFGPFNVRDVHLEFSVFEFTQKFAVFCSILDSSST